jgi:membrane protease YdiL (CAAX protease family)
MSRATGAARLRSRATLAAPVAVPVTMALVFTALRRRFAPRTAYAAGFAVYWVGWCAGFPLWVLGPRGVVRALCAGSRPAPVDVALLALPVAGAAGAALWPQRHRVDRRVAGVMVGTAAVNAVGEELLWRGAFLDQFPDDVVRAALWPLAGFTLWHLAPQLVHPSPRGRVGFLLGAAVVGAASTAVAWRTRGLRAVVLSHVLTDACGVDAARFWLGR